MATKGETTKGRRAPTRQERQRDPERTKARIIEAAIAEFSAKGFAGARVSEIAARAGVNQQLIAYYFDSKEGLHREIGRQWLTFEARSFPDKQPYAEQIAGYVRVSADPRLGGRMLAWEGLEDTGADDADTDERSARLRHEVDVLRERQQTGELDPELDPAALLLIGMSAANALTVYPQVARALFGADDRSPEVVERYAAELSRVLSRLSPVRP